MPKPDKLLSTSMLIQRLQNAHRAKYTIGITAVSAANACFTSHYGVLPATPSSDGSIATSAAHPRLLSSMYPSQRPRSNCCARALKLAIAWWEIDQPQMINICQTFIPNK